MTGEPDGGPGPDDPVELPLDGTLDLHAFRPAEVRAVVRDWLTASRAAGVRAVRIVHGKGTGTLRRIVRATLAETPWARNVRDGGEGGGSWGATLADLDPLPPDQDPVGRAAARKE